MPRGIYDRRKSRKTATKRRKYTRNRVRDKIARAEDSDFLSHGSTHTRERAKELFLVTKRYDALREHALEMATFISHVSLSGTDVPDEVKRAALAVLIRVKPNT